VRGGSLIMVTMVVLSLLDVLHLVINTSLGEDTVLSLRRAIDHASLSLYLVIKPVTGWIAILIGMVG
jgi:hypothetical protein